MVNINWYPGHMVKAQKEIQDNLKLIDVAVEILDARIPKSSRNPKIDNILGNKPRIIVLNKSDLASEIENERWQKYFREKGFRCVTLDTLTGKGIKELSSVIKQLGSRDLSERQLKLVNRSVKALIVGIPNVGKSSIINKISKKNSADVSNKPGVTRKKQWIRFDEGIELMDTPGILWPDLTTDNAGFNLAVTGNIKQDILDNETISYELVKALRVDYFDKLKERYRLDDSDNELEDIELFEKIGRKRGCIKGKEIDYDKTSNIILNDFKTGSMGRITLEKC